MKTDGKVKERGEDENTDRNSGVTGEIDQVFLPPVL